ncbi:ComEC/Rec2 family competence protein, partial [Megasphaera sp.]|uniref:ComEC/Rec2 family competence protein n=1 Tax=Megasphaera sp. TaxID=2023260 RepID=UPI003F016E8D
MGKVKPEWVSLSLVLALAGGIVLADALSLALSLWISLFLLSLLGLFFFRSRSRIALVICLVLAALSLGAGRLQLETERYEALPHQAAGARLTVEGTLQERRSTYTNEKGQVGRYIMQVQHYAYDGEADVQPGKGCIYVTLPEPQVVGSTVVVTGDSRPLTYYKNDGMYDAMHRDREKAICLRLFADDGEKVAVTAPPGRWEAFLQDLRQALTGRYEAVLGEAYAPVLASLLFGGHYEDLPPGLLESFSTTGLIHILSVSGSHVALLLAVIQLMGRALGLRPRGLCLASVSFLFLYGALSDFSSP